MTTEKSFSVLSTDIILASGVHVPCNTQQSGGASLAEGSQIPAGPAMCEVTQQCSLRLMAGDRALCQHSHEMLVFSVELGADFGPVTLQSFDSGLI